MYKEYLNTALNESLKTFESRSRNNIPKRKLKESNNSGMPRKVTVDDLINMYDGNEMDYDQASGLTQMTTNIICNDEPIDSLSWEFDASNYPQYFGDSDNPKDDWDGFFDDPEVRDIMQEFVDKLNKTIQSIYEPGDVICINNTPYDYKYAVYLTEGMGRKNRHHKSIHEAKKITKK